MQITKVSIITLSFLLYENVAVSQSITTGTLLNEMIDLERLVDLSGPDYKTIQFSSYDRRSTSISEQGWFANRDGSGNEPIPGFVEVVKEPDESGIGTYLICDLEEPGVIVRLWTAGINGRIRIFLDDSIFPLYDGSAENFFWRMVDEISPRHISYENIFRQFDASYFPIPFARKCRIEWIGNIKDIHYYHVGVRVYSSDVIVETFNPIDLITYSDQIEKVKNIFLDPDKYWEYYDANINEIKMEISPNSKKELVKIEGTRAIEYFSLKLEPSDQEFLLRQAILKVYFDGASVPQIQSPIGDFFGSSPGINPYRSLSFSVLPDGTMICRFVMPFQKSARIEIENQSDSNIHLTAGLRISGYEWTDGESMHFHARWRINHNLNTTPKDIPFLIAFGQGRIVGTSVSLYNSCNIPTSYGDWWGEGDEKIFVDNDTFPSFFGTGSEDYFNYSWGSTKVFSFPFCGQPRNDGPGNRGFVTNFRFHTLDDIPFRDRIAVYMELLHQDKFITDFSYGRIIYLYALPGLMDDNIDIVPGNTSTKFSFNWKPEARFGSDGYSFIEGEDLAGINNNINTSIEESYIWSGNKILMWKPEYYGENICFQLHKIDTIKNTGFAITAAHTPRGGKFLLYINDSPIKLSYSEWCHSDSCYSDTVDLYEPHRKLLRTFMTEKIKLQEYNKVKLVYIGDGIKNEIGIDFIWLKE